MLQWGRDLLVAERNGRSGRSAYPHRASMGPRLVSRGKFGLPPQFRDFTELQWGRDLLVAESEIARARISAEAELQWGRDLLVAESTPMPLFYVR